MSLPVCHVAQRFKKHLEVAFFLVAIFVRCTLFIFASLSTVVVLVLVLFCWLHSPRYCRWGFFVCASAVSTSCLSVRSFLLPFSAMALRLSWLLCVWLLVLAHTPLGMPAFPPKGKGSQHSWGGNSYRYGRGQYYGQGSSGSSGYGNFGQNQYVNDRLDHIQCLVEEAVKQQKKSKKQRRASSYSSSSSSGSRRRRKGDRKKKGKKSKKDRSRSNDNSKGQASSAGIAEEERKELLELRRQAEVRRIRDEVVAEMGAKPKDVLDEKVLTPKTRRVVAAEARLHTQEGIVQVVDHEAGSWQEVAEQLSSQALPAVKNLLRQLRPNDDKAIPRGKAEVVREVVAELQRKLE